MSDDLLHVHVNIPPGGVPANLMRQIVAMELEAAGAEQDAWLEAVDAIYRIEAEVIEGPAGLNDPGRAERIV